MNILQIFANIGEEVLTFIEGIGALIVGNVPQSHPVYISVSPTVDNSLADTGIASGNPINDYSVYTASTINVANAYQIANAIIHQYPKLSGVSPRLVATIAINESGGNSPTLNLKAQRYEPAFHDTYVPDKDKSYATSYGPMQILLQTAVETYNAGFKDFGFPTPELLMEPVAGMYFGIAYIKRIMNWCQTHGIVASDAIIVMSYNGGFGANNSQTQQYYQKYLANINVLDNALA